MIPNFINNNHSGNAELLFLREYSVANAEQVYTLARSKAAIRRLWSRLTGAPYSLQDLGSETRRCAEIGSHYLGTRTVELSRIQGSEGRSLDFDQTFNPRHNHTKSRWLAVYSAWHNGVVLPPVELIQAGEVYFVRDGHHRVSVARASGNKYIDAIVTKVTLGACQIK